MLVPRAAVTFTNFRPQIRLRMCSQRFAVEFTRRCRVSRASGENSRKIAALFQPAVGSFTSSCTPRYTCSSLKSNESVSRYLSPGGSRLFGGIRERVENTYQGEKESLTRLSSIRWNRHRHQSWIQFSFSRNSAQNAPRVNNTTSREHCCGQMEILDGDFVL